MSNIEHELGKLFVSCFFREIRSVARLPAARTGPYSQIFQPFITPEGIFSLTRVIHGTTNALAHLQSALIEVIPLNLPINLLAWLDENLFYDKIVSGIISIVHGRFRLLAVYKNQSTPGNVRPIRKENPMMPSLHIRRRNSL